MSLTEALSGVSENELQNELGEALKLHLALSHSNALPNETFFVFYYDTVVSFRPQTEQ